MQYPNTAKCAVFGETALCSPIFLTAKPIRCLLFLEESPRQVPLLGSVSMIAMPTILYYLYPKSMSARKLPNSSLEVQGEPWLRSLALMYLA